MLTSQNWKGKPRICVNTDYVHSMCFRSRINHISCHDARGACIVVFFCYIYIYVHAYVFNVYMHTHTRILYTICISIIHLIMSIIMLFLHDHLLMMEGSE